MAKVTKKDFSFKHPINWVERRDGGRRTIHQGDLLVEGCITREPGDPSEWIYSTVITKLTYTPAGGGYPIDVTGLVSWADGGLGDGTHLNEIAEQYAVTLFDEDIDDVPDREELDNNINYEEAQFHSLYQTVEA